LGCALALSAVAAYYSIVGLATIFSSAFMAVIIMACMLEISKLVVTSYLYHQWHVITGPIKTYLMSAVIILMLITSLGIFGFLSRAHVEQNLHNSAVNMQIEQMDARIRASGEIIARYQEQLDQLNRSINMQLDANRAAQALAARQRQTSERDQIRQRLDVEQARISDLQQQRLGLVQQVRVLESEVGPIRYVAEFFVEKGSVDLEKAVRWMIVVIVLVFDPLAILMLIAANMSLAHESRSMAPALPSKEQVLAEQQIETLLALKASINKMSDSVDEQIKRNRDEQARAIDNIRMLLDDRLTTSQSSQHARAIDRVDQEDQVILTPCTVACQQATPESIIEPSPVASEDPGSKSSPVSEKQALGQSPKPAWL